MPARGAHLGGPTGVRAGRRGGFVKRCASFARPRGGRAPRPPAGGGARWARPTGDGVVGAAGDVDAAPAAARDRRQVAVACLRLRAIVPARRRAARRRPPRRAAVVRRIGHRGGGAEVVTRASALAHHLARHVLLQRWTRARWPVRPRRAHRGARARRRASAAAQARLAGGWRWTLKVQVAKTRGRGATAAARQRAPPWRRAPSRWSTWLCRLRVARVACVRAGVAQTRAGCAVGGTDGRWVLARAVRARALDDGEIITAWMKGLTHCVVSVAAAVAVGVERRKCGGARRPSGRYGG